MVYYHTSANVKMLRNIVIDYNSAEEVSPYEYMKTYVEKCPEDIEETKLCWIADTFLGVQKHIEFLKSISSHMSEELSEEEQDYFTIIFHAVTFQIEPKDMQLLYKCLFNLSKTLLNIFTKFLGNNEVLTFISQVAQTSYDTDFITEKIVGPLFMWQPYISEMGHSYSQYIKKIESRKLKPPTIPIQPNVLNRKSKEPTMSPTNQVSVPATPPNSLRVKGLKRMLTKKTIDQKLKHMHEKNKQKAAILLNGVKTQNFHYAQDKSVKYYKTMACIRDEVENDFVKTTPLKQRQKIVTKQSVPIKETAATLKRMNKNIQMAEQEEVQWLQNLLNNCSNNAGVEELEVLDRQEREKQRLCDIERKHLLGQISHEEAFLAKKKLQEDNKKKYEEFVKEREIWTEEIEKLRKIELERNRKQVEKLSMIELNLLQAKNESTAKKKEMVDEFKRESEMLLAKSMKKKQEELERRINMIKEMRILAMIAKKAQLPKIIDLTETSGIGSLCEMSMAELQERLSMMKMELVEGLNKKKKEIRDHNIAAKEELENTKKNISNYMNERAALRKQNKKPNLTSESTSSKEINYLKKVLEEKRKLRVQLGD